MPDDVVRVGVTPRYVVTHELTDQGLLISPDQTVTVEAGQETTVPLGELVPADPIVTDEPPAAEPEEVQEEPLRRSRYSPPPPAPAPEPEPTSTAPSQSEV